MLFDLHAHTSGISACCRAPAHEIVRAALAAGLDGIVLTNHYYKAYVQGGDNADFARRYVREYAETREYGEAAGLRVLYGMEVTMELHGGAHILVYGVSPEFTLAHPDVFDLPLCELYALVHENGGILVQAHPFRGGKNTLQDLAYLDGLEANSHPLYDGTHFHRLAQIARSRGLILTSGGDYHADTQRPRCGTYLPDSVETTQDLCAFLRRADAVDLEIQEPGEIHSRRVNYRRHPEETAKLGFAK